MTSMPASRRGRAMIFAPRSWPSRPGLATTTRILRAVAALTGGADPTSRRPPRAPPLADVERHRHAGVHVADELVGPAPAERLAEAALLLQARAEAPRAA